MTLAAPDLRLVEAELDCFADRLEAELAKMPVTVRRLGRAIETSATREQLRGACFRAGVAGRAFHVSDVPSALDVTHDLDPRIR